MKQREQELWQRALDEKDPKIQLVKFGQFLHFLQDEGPHKGFNKVTGHGSAGHKPDSMGNDAEKTKEATKRTLDLMAQKLKHRGGTPRTIDFDKDVQPILDQLIRQSTPGFGGNGGKDDVKNTIRQKIKENLADKIPKGVKTDTKF